MLKCLSASVASPVKADNNSLIAVLDNYVIMNNSTSIRGL